MEILTKSQIKALEAIVSFEQRFGRFPRLRELAEELGLRSHLSAYDRIRSLIKNGALIYRKEDSGKPSPFELSPEARKLVNWTFSFTENSKSAVFNSNSPAFINYDHIPSRIRANDTSNSESSLKINLTEGIPSFIMSSNSTKVIASAISVLSFSSLAAGLMIYTQRSAIEIGSILLLAGGLNFQFLKPVLFGLKKEE